ncbi:hypothetical protein Slin14017_G033360 [Septoria linicola]|nr:hypothetical protein Slin14017_G033360 [Septoria linicola]
MSSPDASAAAAPEANAGDRIMEQFLPWEGSCTLASGAPLGRPSTFDGTTSSFRHAVNIESDISYCLKQYTIMTGAMQGHRALILVPAGNFRLLDLPIEIRQMIYGYLLTREEPIKLKRYVGRLVQQSFTQGTTKSDGWNVELRKWRSREQHLLAITGVNKEIHQEAAEVLYSTNRFVFQDPQTLSLLSKLARGGTHHFRHIELSSSRGDSSGHLAAAINVLKDCASLRSVRLPHASVCYNFDPASNFRSRRSADSISAKTLVDACLPLLFNLQKARHQRQIMGNVVDILSNATCDCAWCKLMPNEANRRSIHCHCKDFATVKEQEDQFWKTFKDIAGKRLAGKNKVNGLGKKFTSISGTLDSLWQSSQPKTS